MGISNYKQFAPSSFQPGVECVEGLMALGQQTGEKLEQPQRGQGILGGLQRFTDLLSTGEYIACGLLAGKNPFQGIKKKISPSDVIFKKWKPNSKTGKIARAIVGLATDVAFDPTTYLTLGTGGAIKVAIKGGAKVALSKTGKDMLKDFAQELGEKTAKERIATLASKESMSLIERGGLKAIQEAIEKTGGQVTKEEIQKVAREGVEALRSKEGLKWMGIEVIPRHIVNKPFSFMKDVVQLTPQGKKLFTALDETGTSVSKIFNRDYGLDNIAKKNKQELLDGLDNSRRVIRDQISFVFSGLNKTQREAISFAIEGGEEAIKKLDKPSQVAARRTKQIFKSIGREEERRGLLNSWIEDYVTHLYKNTEKGKSFLSDYASGAPSANLRFAKERRIPTITEAENLGFEPIKDIAEILNVRMVASEKAMLAQDFFRKTAITKGVTNAGFLTPKMADLQQSMKRFGELAQEGKLKLPDELKNVYIPENIGQDIIKMNKRVIDNQELNTLLKGYDKTLNFFKGSVTVIFPAFHGRNAISNVLQNFLDIGIQALNPDKHIKAVQIMSGQEGKIVTELGTEYTYKELRKLAQIKGVLQDKVTRIDMERQFAEKPLDTGKFNPFAYGRTVGRGIEGEARLVNFLTHIERGLDPTEAARRTKEFLFDYDSLSGVEKEILRRGIPFYTWTKKNIALQLRSLATDPKKNIIQMKTLRAMEEMFGQPKTDEEKKFAPDFVLAGMNVLLQRK